MLGLWLLGLAPLWPSVQYMFLPYVTWVRMLMVCGYWSSDWSALWGQLDRWLLRGVVLAWLPRLHLGQHPGCPVCIIDDHKTHKTSRCAVRWVLVWCPPICVDAISRALQVG